MAKVRSVLLFLLGVCLGGGAGVYFNALAWEAPSAYTPAVGNEVAVWLAFEGEKVRM